MPPAVKRTFTTDLGRPSSILSTRIPSDTCSPPGSLSDINHPPIIHNQLSISLPDPTLVTMELLALHQVPHQRKQEEAVNQPNTKTMRFLGKIRSFCTITYGKRGSLSTTCAPPACISLFDSTIGTTKILTLPQMARQRKQEESMNSNHRPGETVMRYFTKICKIAFGKHGSFSTNYAQPSYNCPSDVLETMVATHSFSTLATTNSDDTFITADGLIHVSNLAPLASEVVKEELYIRGYLKRPDQDNHFLYQLRRMVVPRLLQVLHARWPKQATAVPVSSKSLQHPSPQAIGRRGGLTVAETLKSANIEENPRTPTSMRPSPSDQSVYWSCRSPQTAIGSSPSPFIQESPMSTTQFCDFCEYSHITSHTTPPSSPELVGLNEKTVLGTMSSSEAALRSLAPRVALMKARHPCMELDARSFQRLQYGEVCHFYHI